MGKEKLDKHKLREDALVSFFRQVILYVRLHRQQVKVCLIVTGAFIVGCIALYMIISNVGLRRVEEFEVVLRTYSYAVSTERTQDLQAAADALKQFIEKHPKGKHHLVARYYLGCCLAKLKKYKEARQILKDFPKWPLKPYVLECIGNTYEQTSDYSTALRYYQKIIDEYPEAPNCAYVLVSIGRCFEKLGKFDKAKESYVKVVTFYRDSTWFEDAKDFLESLP